MPISFLGMSVNQVISLSTSPDGIIGHADWPPPRYVTENHEGVQAVSNAKAATSGPEDSLGMEGDGACLDLPFPDRRSQVAATRTYDWGTQNPIMFIHYI